MKISLISLLLIFSVLNSICAQILCSDSLNYDADLLQEKSYNWKSILNDKLISEWEILGSDKANFYLDRKGVLICETQKDIPNSFMATKKTYKNFILNLEFKIDPELNSGIQIRSGIYEKETTTNYRTGKLEARERTWGKGRVYGYQIEIDPSQRAWTGGFYEEGGRGWLQPLTDNRLARLAYKHSDWNEFKIIANDNHFQSWINGVKATDFYDSEKGSGFIAIQLHSASRDEQIGKKIMLRNLKIIEIP